MREKLVHPSSSSRSDESDSGRSEIKWPSDEEGKNKKGKAGGTPSLGRPRNVAKDEYKRQTRFQDFVDSHLKGWFTEIGTAYLASGVVDELPRKTLFALLAFISGYLPSGKKPARNKDAMIKTLKEEYEKRGRPLDSTGWSPKEVRQFMSWQFEVQKPKKKDKVGGFSWLLPEKGSGGRPAALPKEVRNHSAASRSEVESVPTKKADSSNDLKKELRAALQKKEKTSIGGKLFLDDEDSITLHLEIGNSAFEAVVTKKRKHDEEEEEKETDRPFLFMEDGKMFLVDLSKEKQVRVPAKEWVVTGDDPTDLCLMDNTVVPAEIHAINKLLGSNKATKPTKAAIKQAKKMSLKPLPKDEQPKKKSKKDQQQDLTENSKFVFCNLKAEWYNKIASGEKRVELRGASDYWQARLKDATHVIFRNGYKASMKPKQIRKLDKIRVKDAIKTYGVPKEQAKELFGDFEYVYVIHF